MCQNMMEQRTRFGREGRGFYIYFQPIPRSPPPTLLKELLKSTRQLVQHSSRNTHLLSLHRHHTLHAFWPPRTGQEAPRRLRRNCQLVACFQLYFGFTAQSQGPSIRLLPNLVSSLQVANPSPLRSNTQACQLGSGSCESLVWV
jgi:hypothetical protein